MKHSDVYRCSQLPSSIALAVLQSWVVWGIIWLDCRIVVQWVPSICFYLPALNLSANFFCCKRRQQLLEILKKLAWIALSAKTCSKTIVTHSIRVDWNYKFEPRNSNYLDFLQFRIVLWGSTASHISSWFWCTLLSNARLPKQPNW